VPAPLKKISAETASFDGPRASHRPTHPSRKNLCDKILPLAARLCRLPDCGFAIRLGLKMRAMSAFATPRRMQFGDTAAFKSALQRNLSCTHFIRNIILLLDK